jgi:hypothetical protein
VGLEDSAVDFRGHPEIVRVDDCDALSAVRAKIKVRQVNQLLRWRYPRRTHRLEIALVTCQGVLTGTLVARCPYTATWE